jgi:hypothetical protein
VLATLYRQDLDRAGVGNGLQGFEFQPPHGVTLSGMTVRRSSDGAVITAAVEKRKPVKRAA